MSGHIASPRTRVKNHSTGSNFAIGLTWNMTAYSALNATLNCFTLCLHEEFANVELTTKIFKASPPPVQTELHEYIRKEKG